jgi:hypothetical protein
MSTPIQQDEVSPDDPIFYAPPKWRTGERTAQLPESAGPADWTVRDDGLSFADAFTKSRRHSGGAEHSRVRITAFACAVAVTAWTAFCVTVGLSRIDAPAFAQWRSVPPLAGDSIDSLNERIQAADVALNEVSRPIFPPTLAVADASGLVNSALPLAIKVTNYTPDTMVNLSGLAKGTMLSAGSGAGDGQWRVPIDDLPNAHVIPPSDYVGPMTVVAELRRGDEQTIVRAPVHLTWNSPPSDAIGTEKPSTSSPISDALDDLPMPKEMVAQTPARETVSETTQSRRAKIRKHASKGQSVRRHHRSPRSMQVEQQPSVEIRTASGPFDLFASPNFAFERRQFWNSDFPTSADTNRGRCERAYDCGRDVQR